jgi:hypothetical protein
LPPVPVQAKEEARRQRAALVHQLVPVPIKVKCPFWRRGSSGLFDL